MINYILQSETGSGEQAGYLRARFTIPWVLENTYYCANGIAVTISCKYPCLKFFARLSFKKAAFPFCEQFG